MVYNFFKTLIIFFISINLNANIIYNKKDISISEIEYNFYKDVFNDQKNENLSTNQIIKKIYLIKSSILFYKKNNPEILEIIDNQIKENSSKNNQLNDLEMDFLRYTTLSNEFLINYFRNEFDLSDLDIVFSNLKEIVLPLSLDECLTILKIYNLKNNSSFYESFYFNLMNNTKNYSAEINNEKYNICINQATFKALENEIIIYIRNKSKKKFDKFLYEKIN